MEPCDYCGALMSNDCQACGSPQARVRQSIPFQYLHNDNGWVPPTGMRHCRFAGYPGDQIKAAGQRGSSSPRGFPSFLCGGRPSGDAMAPMCDQGFGPSMGALMPPHVSGKKSLLDEAPEDLPRRNAKEVIPVVIPPDVHQPDQAALPPSATANVPVKLGRLTSCHFSPGVFARSRSQKVQGVGAFSAAVTNEHFIGF
jgi:hypothetical protein